MRRTKRCFLTLMFCLMAFIMTIQVQADTKKPDIPKITSVKKSGLNSIIIKWKNVDNAKKFELYCSIDNGKFKLLKKTTKLTYTHKKLELGHTYRYKLKAINGSKKSKFSSVKKLNLPKYIKSYKLIKTAIENYGDGDGIDYKEIGYNIQYNYLVSIDLDSEAIVLELISYTGDGAEGCLQLEIDEEDWNDGVGRVWYSYEGADELISASCDGIIYFKEYNIDKEIPLIMDEESELYGFPVDEFFKGANTALRLTLYGCDYVLNKRLGITLNNLGFKSLKLD